MPANVAAYYFPNWHRDPLNDKWYGEGWTEWNLVRAARPRYEGHRQPIVPAWGEFDEADPKWAERQVDAAADHALTAFLFDWYWYEGRPYLQRALEEGFLRAGNQHRMKFALMWANHDWLDLHPATYQNPRTLLARGDVDRAGFEGIAEYIVERYFRSPSYLHINGAPYFSIYELGTFIRGMGSVAAAKEALASLRGRARAAGFPDVHLNAVVWGLSVLPSEVPVEKREEVLSELGFASATTYAWVHHFDPGTVGFPRSSYTAAAEANYAAWEKYRRALPVPYHPNVSMGWDSSPRTQQTSPYGRRGYPWMAVLEGNTPGAFEASLRRAKEFADRDGGPNSMVTINAWNEWTEGSYLLPNTVTGMGYLEAVQRVFGR